MGVAFRHLLALASGEPADPAAFVTEVPGWKVGDTFLAGEELQRCRILAIDPSLSDDAAGWDALVVVEPFEGLAGSMASGLGPVELRLSARRVMAIPREPTA